MKLFEKNVGGLDKVARLAFGALLLIVAYFLQADIVARSIVGLVGAIVLFTGISGSCLLYSLIGLNTAKK